MAGTGKVYDSVIIGGGPAGMMAAITLAERGYSVIIAERNKLLGRKLRITGKGRCNITNNCDLRGLTD
ncbi:MAG: NAD(P)/FAD-dependent oxidoreductase, partial [Clostridia bacterium]|nr:NAD(P)/FAD-dependent oxidoreductase [Clostridia bacterium]